jgi:hypothetical protein
MIAGCVLVIGSIFFTRGTGRDLAEYDEVFINVIVMMHCCD